MAALDDLFYGRSDAVALQLEKQGLDPSTAEGWTAAGDKFSETGFLPHAVDCYKMALGLAKEFDSRVQPGKKLALCLERLRRYDEAFDAYNVYGEDELSPLRYLVLVACNSFNAVGEFPDSVSDGLEAAMERSAEDACDAEVAYGDMCLFMRRYSAAEELYDMVLQQDSEHEAALRGAGDARYFQDHHCEAIPFYEALTTQGAVHSGDLARLGECYRNTKTLADGIQTLERLQRTEIMDRFLLEWKEMLPSVAL